MQIISKKHWTSVMIEPNLSSHQFEENPMINGFADLADIYCEDRPSCMSIFKDQNRMYSIYYFKLHVFYFNVMLFAVQIFQFPSILFFNVINYKCSVNEVPNSIINIKSIRKIMTVHQNNF